MVNRKINSGNKLSRLFDFDFSITKERIPNILPFVLFISLLIILYIGNKYYSEKSYLEENRLRNELKELRAESLTTKAELVNKTKESEVAKIVEKIGLEEVKEPPKKIIVEKGEY
ncbi:MAG: hypothetical protein H8E61_08640 [Bacteroidetes bacterium]|nr:hypothetical protein [Bacteroidota bacterium]